MPDDETTYDIAYQMQNGLDYTPLNKVMNRRYLNEQKHGLFESGGARGLNLSKGYERGLDMAYDKQEVPELNELNVSYNRAYAPSSVEHQSGVIKEED